MKRISYLIFFISFILLSISTFAFISLKMPLDKIVYPASVNITRNVMGIDVNKTALTFGKVTLGGSMKRNIVINNEYDFPVIAYLESDGNISNILYYENNVEIEPGEEKKISIHVISETDNDYGLYDGNVTILLYKKQS